MRAIVQTYSSFLLEEQSDQGIHCLQCDFIFSKRYCSGEAVLFLQCGYDRPCSI